MSSLDPVSAARARLGFLPLSDVLLLAGRHHLLDPHSLLISPGVILGEGNVFYPHVVLECAAGSTLTIGSGNHVHPGFIAQAMGGHIQIGDANQLGPGPVSLRADGSAASIHIGSGGRYMQGVAVTGRCVLGSGSQLLGGWLTVHDCELAAGGDHRSADVDARAGVIKGQGVVRGARVGVGEVINGRAMVDITRIERQALYHPR